MIEGRRPVIAATDDPVPDRNLSGNTLRHNGIHLVIASAARTLRLKAGLNDDLGDDVGRIRDDDVDLMRPGRQRV